MSDQLLFAADPQLVCLVCHCSEVPTTRWWWQGFEADSWCSYFPTKTSLRWRAAAVSIIPVLAETRLASAAASTRSNGPFDPNKACGLKWSQHLWLSRVKYRIRAAFV